MRAPSSKRPTPLNAKDTGPLFQIATTYAQQDNIPMALQTVDRVLAVDPRNIQALVFKADLYARQHDDARTSEAYDDAVVAAATDDEKVAIMMRKAGYFVAEHEDPQADAILQQMTYAVSQGRRRLRRLRRLLCVASINSTSGRRNGKPRSRSTRTTRAPCWDSAKSSMQAGKLNDSISYLASLHASLARRAGLRAAGPSILARPRLLRRARCVRQELRDCSGHP